MRDGGSPAALGAFFAVVVAALIVGSLYLYNWLGYKVMSEAIKQPAYGLPTSQVEFPVWSTPWAVSTPLFDPSTWYFDYAATPTPKRADVIIIQR